MTIEKGLLRFEELYFYSGCQMELNLLDIKGLDNYIFKGRETPKRYEKRLLVTSLNNPSVNFGAA